MPYFKPHSLPTYHERLDQCANSAYRLVPAGSPCTHSTKGPDNAFACPSLSLIVSVTGIEGHGNLKDPWTGHFVTPKMSVFKSVFNSLYF